MAVRRFTWIGKDGEILSSKTIFETKKIKPEKVPSLRKAHVTKSDINENLTTKRTIGKFDINQYMQQCKLTEQRKDL